MTNHTPTAAELLASALSEDSEREDAFEVFKHSPSEFRWIRYGNTDPVFTYEKRAVAKVITVAGTASRRSGSTSTGPTGLAGMILPCSDCLSAHTPLHPCLEEN